VSDGSDLVDGCKAAPSSRPYRGASVMQQRATTGPLGHPISIDDLGFSVSEQSLPPKEPDSHPGLHRTARAFDAGGTVFHRGDRPSARSGRPWETTTRGNSPARRKVRARTTSESTALCGQDTQSVQRGLTRATIRQKRGDDRDESVESFGLEVQGDGRSIVVAETHHRQPKTPWAVLTRRKQQRPNEPTHRYEPGPSKPSQGRRPELGETTRSGRVWPAQPPMSTGMGAKGRGDRRRSESFGPG